MAKLRARCGQTRDGGLDDIHRGKRPDHTVMKKVEWPVIVSLLEATAEEIANVWKRKGRGVAVGEGD